MFVQNLRKCSHSLAFSVRLCVVRKPLRKIFLQAKIFARKELTKGKRRKKEKIIVQSRSNCIRLNILFDCLSYEQITNKMAANKEELSVAVQKFPVIFDLSNKDFHRKDVEINA